MGKQNSTLGANSVKPSTGHKSIVMDGRENCQEHLHKNNVIKGREMLHKNILMDGREIWGWFAGTI